MAVCEPKSTPTNISSTQITPAAQQRAHGTLHFINCPGCGAQAAPPNLH